MHRSGCEYLMPAVIIAFPFIKVYSWKKYTALRLWAVYFFVSLGGALGRAGAGSIPRQCAEGGHAKKCVRRGLRRMVSKGQLFKKAIFLQLRIKTARHARKRGVFEIHKTNYVVKTTELGRNRAAGAETGCFRDSQNELRCKNNGIRGETARWTRKLGVLGIHKTKITLLKQRNSQRNRAAGAVSKWKAVRAAARCQKSVRKTQIGRARRFYF